MIAGFVDPSVVHAEFRDCVPEVATVIRPGNRRRPGRRSSSAPATRTGDGLIVGAGDLLTSKYRGAAFLMSGATGKLLYTTYATGQDYAGFWTFGRAVAGLGDLNGDGWPDFVAGGFGRVEAQSARPLDLSSLTTEVSIFLAGHQLLDIHAGKARANQIALVLGSGSGTSPGIAIAGGTLRLNPDGYFGFTVAAPLAVIYGNLAVLDAEGNGRVAFRLPPGLPASLAGTVLHHSCLFLGGAGIAPASNSVRVELTKF